MPLLLPHFPSGHLAGVGGRLAFLRHFSYLFARSLTPFLKVSPTPPQPLLLALSLPNTEKSSVCQLSPRTFKPCFLPDMEVTTAFSSHADPPEREAAILLQPQPLLPKKLSFSTVFFFSFFNCVQDSTLVPDFDMFSSAHCCLLLVIVLCLLPLTYLISPALWYCPSSETLEFPL